MLHSHHWFSGAAALPVARERGIPHVQSFHSIAAASDTPLSEGERPESAGREAGERLLARESDAVSDTYPTPRAV
ncbi:glycosyltransferase, partial [Curtobacterium sp. Csp2]|uniref:glycosyltransferase n=1 Tax=Curtobacterium sp. Csp2 TaxID=2495430 RepID=UPI0034A0D117